MGGYGDVQMIDENGVRADGRGPGDIRPITIGTGVVPVADGSCRMTWGTNEAIVAVYGPDGGPSQEDSAARPCCFGRSIQHGSFFDN